MAVKQKVKPSGLNSESLKRNIESCKRAIIGIEKTIKSLTIPKQIEANECYRDTLKLKIIQYENELQLKEAL